MATQFEPKYRVKSGDDMDADFFNKRFRDLDARLAAAEDALNNLDAARDKLVELGLEQLDATIASEIEGLQELINSAEVSVAGAQALLTALEADLATLAGAFDAIITGGSLPAASVSVAAISGLAATHAQGAFAEHQGDIETLTGAIAAKAANIVVANVAARDALAGLVVGNTVFVVDDDGASHWAFYSITAVTNGAWGTSTKELITDETQTLDIGISDVTGLQSALDGKAAASHSHAIANVTGLQTALDGKAAATHGHAIGDVSGLQTALDGKSATGHTHTIGNISGLQNALDAKEPLGQTTINPVSGATHVLGLTDAGKTVERSHTSAATCEVPNNSTVAFPVNTYLNVVQTGAGAVTITPAAGVTLRNRNGLKLGGQWAMATLYKRATNEWVVGGDLMT